MNMDEPHGSSSCSSSEPTEVDGDKKENPCPSSESSDVDDINEENSCSSSEPSEADADKEEKCCSLSEPPEVDDDKEENRCPSSEPPEVDDDNEENSDLFVIYNIFKEIYSKAPAVLKDLSSESVDIDYKESINDQIDFIKIKKKLQNEDYVSVADALKDIRLVLLNCYKFYGTKDEHTRKSLKIEEQLENKLSFLDEDLKSQTSIQLTFSLLNMEDKQSFKFRYPKNYYDSALLRAVAHYRPERLKEYHKIFSNTLTTDEDKAHNLEEIISWENEIFFNDNYRYISAMWELPEIGNFMAIIFKELDLDIVNQGEIERMFLMPKESSTMSKVLTTLLMPVKKTKYTGKLMPYKIWSEKLCKKVSEWYKIYHMRKRNKVSVFKLLGIHPDFWAVMGEINPLDDCDYWKLSYFMKVWLVKGLCDYVANKYKTINDIITNCMERQCTIWKNDMETEEYFYFNSMPDLRIYYRNIPYDEPSLEFLKSEKTDEDGMENVLSNTDTTSVLRTTNRVKPNEKNFKLIANSVQGLRSFLYELDTEDTSVPESLIQAIDDFIIKIEPEEYNLIVLENNSKIKLFKDWKFYTERLLKEEDETMFWQEKEPKLLSQGVNEEIILEKRKRKAVVKHGFDLDITFDSDEFCSPSEECLSDLSDSEDEWGLKNRPKKKAKLAVQTPSKLVELEKRLNEENKLLKHTKKKENSCSKTNELFEIENETLDLEQNKTNQTQNNILLINDCCNKLVDTKSVDTVNSEIEVSSDEDILLIDSDQDKVIIIDCEEQEKVMPIIKKKNETEIEIECQKQNVVKNNSCLNMSDTKQIIDVSQSIEIIPMNNISKLNDCETPKKGNLESLTINNSVKNLVSTNKHDSIISKSAKSNLTLNNEVISIDDDDDNDKRSTEIIISDDDDDVQIVSVFSKPCILPEKVNRSYSSNSNFIKSPNPKSRQIITKSCFSNKTSSTIIPKLSSNISIMPANVHVPKGIEVTMVKRPQSTIPSHFNAVKRPTARCNGSNKSNSVVNVECKVISKPDLNGEVKFYINLPNGKLHPVSDILMNQYLKEHNNRLPDYWMVPLPVEVAKQYGFN